MPEWPPADDPDNESDNPRGVFKREHNPELKRRMAGGPQKTHILLRKSPVVERAEHGQLPAKEL